MESNIDGSSDVIDGKGVSHWHRPLGRRNVIAGIAGFGIAASIGAREVLAQESTPEVDDSDESDPGEDDQAPTGEMAAERGAAYENFVGKVSTNLGEPDTAAVDTAIRDALKAMVDEQFDAGKISENLATKLKEKIDTSPAPLPIGMRGGLRQHRMERRGKRRHDRRDGKDGSDDSGQEEPNSSTPTS